MGFFDSMKANQMGTKAYRVHVTGMQLRKQGKYEESEAKAVLTVRTMYGDKTFYVNEIQQVLLDDGKGNVRELTKEILG